MNLDELAKKYGGSPVQSGSSKFDELAQKYGGIAVEGGPEEPKKIRAGLRSPCLILLHLLGWGLSEVPKP